MSNKDIKNYIKLIDDILTENVKINKGNRTSDNEDYLSALQQEMEKKNPKFGEMSQYDFNKYVSKYLTKKGKDVHDDTDNDELGEHLIKMDVEDYGEKNPERRASTIVSNKITEDVFPHKKFHVGMKVKTPMGEGHIEKIELESTLEKQRSLTGSLKAGDKRKMKRALIKFKNGNKKWFSLFQLS